MILQLPLRRLIKDQVLSFGTGRTIQLKQKNNLMMLRKFTRNLEEMLTAQLKKL